MNRKILHIIKGAYCSIRNCNKLLVFCILLFQAYFTFAQSSIVSITDAVTGQPVSFAQILAETITGRSTAKLISDKEGMVNISLSYPFLISVSCLGYESVVDTISIAGKTGIKLTPDFYELDRVIVTGQLGAQPVDKSIYRIGVIDRKEISLKAANNLGDILRNNLSFQYRSEGVLGDFIRFRGLTGEHIKILVDGMPVTGRVFNKIDLGQLSLYTVDHIEIIEGPMSVVYGSNALAGAINLITTDYSQKELLATVNAYYETVGVYNIEGDFSKRFGKNTISISAGRNFYSGWGPVDTTRDKIWKPKLQYLTAGSYAYRAKNLSLQCHSDFLYEELRDLGPLELENLYEKAIDGYHYTTRWNNRLNLKNKFGGKLITELQAGYSYYRKSKITYLNDLVNLEKSLATDNSLHDTTQFHLVSVRGIVSDTIGKTIKYQAGFDFSGEIAEGKRTRGRQHISDMAGFINAIYTPFSGFSIQPGLRIMHNSKYPSPLIYALNLKYRPKDFAFRASYARGFNAPTLKQLYLEFIDNNHEVIGNPELTPEMGQSINLSSEYNFRLRRQRIILSAGLFYNSINDAIQLAVDTARPGWGTYFNVEGNNFITKGLEVNLRSSILPGVTLDAGIITTGHNKINDINEFHFSTDYTLAPVYKNARYNFEMAVFYKYTDSYLEFAGNFNADGELSGVAQRYVEGYNILDLTISKYLYENRLCISGGIKNLFNVSFIDSNGNLNFHGSSGTSTAIGYGRTFFIKFVYAFEK